MMITRVGTQNSKTSAREPYEIFRSQWPPLCSIKIQGLRHLPVNEQKDQMGGLASLTRVQALHRQTAITCRCTTCPPCLVISLSSA